MLVNRNSKRFKAIDEYEEKIIKRVNELANKSRQEIRYKHEEHKTALDMNVHALDAALAATTVYADKLELIDNEQELFAAVNTSKIVAKDAERLLQEMMAEWKERKINLYIARKLQDIVDGLDSLGGCTVREYKATFYRNIDTTQRRESNTCVYDMCFMDSGDLLLTDFNNKKLKRFNSNLLTKDQILLPGSPVAVCKIDEHEVAVRLRDSNMVQFVSVGQSMKSHHSFRLSSGGYGMVYNAGSEEIFACEGRKVSVYSKTGTALRTFGEVATIFYECQYMQIALSESHKDIYVSNHSTGLNVLDNSGHLKMKLSSAGINDTWPLCVLPSGICLTGSESSGVIVQLDKDGHRIGTLIDNKEKRTSTYCVAYDPGQSKLAVGGSPGVISVYTLSPN